MKMLRKTAAILLLFAPVLAANAQTEARSPELFDSRNAIIDTAIPFAIGAQEAQQSLRGSFGWQTFQEGLVEGVYYRFDPDGYARFAPTPRLDQDQFQVVCVPRSYVCTGQKGGFHLSLTQRGQLQIQIENLGAGDQFFLSDGVNELPLPARILEPLDIGMESLLTSGGELIIKRNGQPVSNISLTGFSAVSAYIRWVAAGQDYSVLPRNWPIPNSATSATNRSITQPDTWTRPVLASQSVVPWPNVNVPVGSRTVAAQEPYDPSRPLTRILAPDQTSAPAVDEIGALKLEIMRLSTQLESTGRTGPAPAAAQVQPIVPPLATNNSDEMLAQILGHLSNIEQALNRIAQIGMGQAQRTSTQPQISGLGAQLNTAVPPEGQSGLTSLLIGNSAIIGATATMIPSGLPLRDAPVSPVAIAPAEPVGLESEILKAIRKLAAQEKAGATAPIASLPVVENNLGFSDSKVVLERSIVEQILAELDSTSQTEASSTILLQSEMSETGVAASESDAAQYKSLADYFQDATKN